MRILLAEDEMALAKALVKIFEKNNYSADAVYDGEEALAYLETGNYDVAVLDVMMPKMDGITVLKTVVTTHIGVIPEEKTHPRYRIMLEALTECGLYAKERGVTLAIETGPESAVTLLQFLKDTKGGVGVNLDPANFVMVTGQDPVAAVEILGEYIVHTHLKDGKKLSSEFSPEEVYHAFAIGGVEALNACTGFVELPIGSGDVSWPDYLDALRKIGYQGYLTIERETGDNPFVDIQEALRFIRRYL